MCFKWLSGSLYRDTTGIFSDVQTDKGVAEGENIVMCLLNTDATFYVS